MSAMSNKRVRKLPMFGKTSATWRDALIHIRAHSTRRRTAEIAVERRSCKNGAVDLTKTVGYCKAITQTRWQCG